MTSKIVQIVPAYPPSPSGVGDYASALATLCSAGGNNLVTIVTSTCLHVGDADSVIHIQPKESHLTEALNHSQPLTVLLHFSGYGYAHWGLCYWLVKSLYKWKRDDLNHRLVILFHEVFATGPIWKSVFWISPFQRRIAKELAAISDKKYVTSIGGLDQLMGSCDASLVSLLPVFSTIGEPLSVKPLAMRRPSAVVFGATATRARCYSSAIMRQEALKSVFDRIGVEEVVDVGFGDCAPKLIAGRYVRVLGSLQQLEISVLLGESRLALIDYSYLYIDKSTVAAAYLAHGCLLVNVSKHSIPMECRSGFRKVCTNLDQILDDDFDPAAFSMAGFTLYQEQRSDAILSELLSSVLPSAD